MCIINHWIEKFEHFEICVNCDQIKDELPTFVQSLSQFMVLQKAQVD